MKQPLYALLIAPNHRVRTSILYGGRSITIREGHPDYKAGTTVMICCHIEPWVVMADITSVRHTTIAKVTKEEYEADDFFSRKDLLKGLQKYYPDITIDSPVTVIRWENVRGWLKDNDTKYRLNPQKLYSEINPKK